MDHSVAPMLIAPWRETTLCEAKMPVATILVHTKNVYDFVSDVKMQFSGVLFV